jgi:hypothetical protein
VPSSEIEQIFSKTPRIVILSTELYKDQDKNWWYLAPESGQHVFFYSIQSMQWIAKNYGYKLVMSGGYSIFIRQDFYSFFRAQLIKFFAKYKTSRVLLSLVFWLPTRGVNSDYSHQLEILQRRQNPPRV